MMKRTLALLLSFVMLLGMLPATAFANEALSFQYDDYALIEGEVVVAEDDEVLEIVEVDGDAYLHAKASAKLR